MTARPFGLDKILPLLGRGKKAVANSLKFAEIRISEGQIEPALQLLERGGTLSFFCSYMAFVGV